MKKLVITIILILCSIFYYLCFIEPYNCKEAEKNFYSYIETQGIKKENIQYINVVKETKIGGIQYQVKYEDDPELTYHYTYSNGFNSPYKINLTVYKDQTESILLGVKPKYPGL